MRLFGPVFLVSQLEVDILYTEPGLRGKGLQWKIYRNPARQEEYVYTAAMPAPLARAAPSAFPSIEPESLSALLDLAPDAFVVVDSRAILVPLNAQVETLFGYRREELVGQALERLLPGRLQAAHAARRAAYLRTAQPRPMGVGKFPVDMSLRPGLARNALYVIAALRDMTAQRLADQERLHVLQVILACLPSGVFLVRGPQMQLILANRAANALWGARAFRGRNSCASRASIFSRPMDDLSVRTIRRLDRQ